jgi:hypothetical protein
VKKYTTIGCCGIDCALCPRFHTNGASACPGCGALDFREKHPSCGFLTCCVTKHGFEVCADCPEYPCKRFDTEKNGLDSFVTHQKVFKNLDTIKAVGIDQFLNEQLTREEILISFLNEFDDGRSKSFFCISCSLLPLDKLLEIKAKVENFEGSKEIKEKNIHLRNMLTSISVELGIILKLNKHQQRSKA